MVTSYVKPLGGVPTLFVNDQPVTQTAYMTYYMHNARYSDFASAGYALYSLPVYFAEQTINENSQIPPFTKGIFDTDIPDYSVFDGHVRDILDACPDAYIFPRVNMSVPATWEDSHPDELCDNGANGNRRRYSPASDLWAEETKHLLKLFIEHIESSDFCDHIIGYHLVGGNTEEWIPFDGEGFVGKRTREKYEACKINGTDDEYYRFLSDIIADRVCEFSAFVKELTDRRLIVGAFYGYTFDLSSRKQCHHMMKKVLACDDVDFICSPMTYMNTRDPLIDQANMTCVDSIKLHGKLYFVENDTRTYLSKAPNELPNYNLPIWFGPDKAASIENIKKHFARALTHGHGLWWFDMWGGWFDDADIMDVMAKVRSIAAKSLALPRRSTSEVAVFIDEGNYSYIDPDKSNDHRIGYDLRLELGFMGTPYDIYLADDFENVYNNYKAHIFIVPHPTDLIDNCIRCSEKKHIPYTIVTPENKNISYSELHEFCKGAGVYVYTDSKAIIYACESYVFMFNAEDGLFDMKLPDGFSYTDMFTGKVLSIGCELKAGKSYLFGKI